MADVEKININSTDYDIADAKALRNKSTADTNSFIDERAGTSSYPTTQSYPESNIIGYGAYAETSENLTAVTAYGYGAKIRGSWSVAVGRGAVAAQNSVAYGYGANASVRYSAAFGSNATVTSEYSVAVGEAAKGQGQHSSAIGYKARANTSSVSIGSYSVANGQYDVAIGRSASINSSSISYAIAVGYSSYAQGNSSIAIGASAGVNNNATDSIAIGNSVRANGQRSVAIGKQAIVIQSESVQLGQGTNTKYGSLQFRSWQVIDGDGQIPLERIPAGVQFAVDNIPTVPNNFYYPDDDSKQLAVLYKGETVKDENDDDVLVRDLCYRTKTSYSRPHFWCSLANENYVPNANKDIIYIDQEKLFLKLAEISRTNIDDDNYAGSYVGGDNSSQDMCFYYDGTHQTWSIEFGSDSVETGGSTAPDTIDGITDLREYGIYITGELNLPEEDYEEIFDIEYYAPIYCDGFDYGDNEFTIDYMKFMDQMRDGNWGFGYATGTDDTWSYSDGTNDWDMPVLPKTYEFNDEEYEDVTIRFEYDLIGGGDYAWHQYINGEDLGYTWSDAQMASIFGIHLNADGQQIEHIEFTFRPAKQIVWEQFDPVDSANFCTKQEKQDIQNEITALQNNSFKLIQNARDLNTMTNSGAYHIQASGCTNLPSTASASIDMFLFVTRTAANNVKQVLITDYVHKSSGGTNYGTYCSNMYVRTLAGGTWRSWEVILTPDDLMFLPNFDKTKKQVIGHYADSTNIMWIDAE